MLVCDRSPNPANHRICTYLAFLSCSRFTEAIIATMPWPCLPGCWSHSFMLLLLVKPLCYSPLSPACLPILLLGILDSPRPLSLGFPSYFSPPPDNALACHILPRQVPAPSRHSVPLQFMLFAPSLLAMSF